MFKVVRVSETRHGVVSIGHRATQFVKFTGCLAFLLCTSTALASTLDTDMDGILDINDLDSDNDGILDINEGAVEERLAGALFNTGAQPTTGPPISGIQGGLVYPTSSPTIVGTFQWDDVRLARLRPSDTGNVIFWDNAQRDALGLANNGSFTITNSAVVSTTRPNPTFENSMFEILDFDGTLLVFQIQIEAQGGVQITDINTLSVEVSGGAGAVQSAVDLGGGVFEYTVTVPATGGDTNLDIRSTVGQLLESMTFTAVNVSSSGDAIAVSNLRTLGTDSDGDGVANHLELDSEAITKH